MLERLLWPKKLTNYIALVQADKLNTIIKAAKIQDVEPIWTSLFAKALAGKDVKDIILNVGSGGGAAAAPAAAGAGGAGGDAPAAEEAKEEKKEGACYFLWLRLLVDAVTNTFFCRSAEAEESDDDMGFGLFD